MSVTQKEIAEKLNVSQAQVARALGGSTRISAATSRRIQDAAREMGYDRFANLEARAMVNRRRSHRGKAPVQNGIIALAFDVRSWVSPQNMPFYWPVFEAMESSARALGLDICFCPMSGYELPRLIRERRVDGVIMLVGHVTDSVQRIQDAGLPVVAFGNYEESTHYIMADDYDGARQATRHLLELGHRNIGFVGIASPDKYAGVLRLQGYLDTLSEYGIPVRDEWILAKLQLPKSTPLKPCIGCDECGACIGWSMLKTKNAITRKTKKLPFTALICHNDAVAMGVIAQAGADGFKTPRDLSVIGFDNVSEQYHFSPQVTSVDVSLSSMGGDAVKLLHRVINSQSYDFGPSDASPGYLRHIVPVHLVPHATSQAPT